MSSFEHCLQTFLDYHRCDGPQAEVGRVAGEEEGLHVAERAYILLSVFVFKQVNSLGNRYFPSGAEYPDCG